MKYKLDTNESYIKWEGSNDDMTNHGTVKFDSGFIENINGGGLSLRGELVIDMLSIKTTEPDLGEEDKKKLTKHLKSKDFFNVEKFEKAIFKIQRIALEKSSGFITGIIKVRDEGFGVTIPTSLELSDGQFSAESQINIAKVSQPLHEFIGKNFKDDTPQINLSCYIVAR